MSEEMLKAQTDNIEAAAEAAAEKAEAVEAAAEAAAEKAEAAEAAIEAALEEEYGIGTDVEVSRSFDDFSYEKIKVVVLDFGINADESHIDILSNVKTRLSGRFGCPVEVT